jgi:hypothetical protein
MEHCAETFLDELCVDAKGNAKIPGLRGPITPPDGGAVKMPMDSIVHSRSKWRLEYPVVCEEGKERWVDATLLSRARDEGSEGIEIELTPLSAWYLANELPPQKYRNFMMLSLFDLRHPWVKNLSELDVSALSEEPRDNFFLCSLMTASICGSDHWKAALNATDDVVPLSYTQPEKASASFLRLMLTFQALTSQWYLQSHGSVGEEEMRVYFAPVDVVSVPETICKGLAICEEDACADVAPGTNLLGMVHSGVILCAMRQLHISWDKVGLVGRKRSAKRKAGVGAGETFDEKRTRKTKDVPECTEEHLAYMETVKERANAEEYHDGDGARIPDNIRNMMVALQAGNMSRMLVKQVGAQKSIELASHCFCQQVQDDAARFTRADMDAIAPLVTAVR